MERLADWLSILGGKDPSTVFAEEGKQLVSASLGVPPPNDPAEKAAHDWLTVEVWERLERAAAAYGEAQTSLVAGAKVRKGAKEAIEKLYQSACGSANKRGPGAKELDRIWNAAKPALDQFGQLDLKSPADILTRAENEATLANSGLERFFKFDLPGFVSYRAREDVKKFTPSMTLLVKSLPTSIAEARSTSLSPLLTDQKVVLAALEGIPTALGKTEWQQSIGIDDDTDRLTVSIRASGKENVPPVKGSVIEDRLSVSVTRLNRFVLSAGIMLSSLDEHDFQRTILQDTTGSIYSTFVDRRANTHIAFAPGIMASLVFAEWHGIGLHVTSGVAARSVNNRVSPDFVVGGGASLADKLFLTLAYHMGRTERLLLGPADSVAGRPVPDEITRDAAVGEQWQGAFAVTFSYRLN